MGHQRRRICFLLALQFFLYLSAGSYLPDLEAQERQPSPPSSVFDLHFTKGVFDINQKMYPEAVEELNKALAARPDDRDASYYLGVSLNRAGRHKEAAEILKKVAAGNPKFEKVHFDLGVAEYYLGDDQAALRDLERAEKSEPKNGLVYYYEGLIYHRTGDYERSSPRFLRALALVPELGLTAHYYAAVGFYRRGIYAEARDEFEEAVKADSGSPVARSARDFLSRLESAETKPRPFSVSVSTAYQYDSNVVLQAGGAPLPSGVSRKGDSRILLFARGDYRFLEHERWSAGASYAFYQSVHFNLRKFDVENHQGGVSLQYRRTGIQVRLPYEFNYALVDWDTYLRSHAVTPTVRIPEKTGTFTEFQYGFTANNFSSSGGFPGNNDRDSVNHRIGVSQTLIIDKSSRVRAGYDYDRELTGNSPTEDDWSYQGHRISGELGLSLPENLRLKLGIDFTLRSYDNPNSFSSPSNSKKRTDHIQNYAASVSWLPGDRATLTLGYLYNKNGSNISVFDYDRNIVSLIATGNF